MKRSGRFLRCTCLLLGENASVCETVRNDEAGERTKAKRVFEEEGTGALDVRDDDSDSDQQPCQ